jgi:glucosamine--fructose-6-phosphate aminotransferase (isomerizing)
LAKKTSECFLSLAGKEEMTSTKTFVSTLLTMFVLSLALADDWNEEKANELNNTINVVEKLLESKNEWLSSSMKILENSQFVQVIGRGPSYSSVLQGALMFMEGARNPAAEFSAESSGTDQWRWLKKVSEQFYLHRLENL